MAINDGSANASIGSPQLPHLLDSYVTRPSWEVAGVDYAVGIPSGTVLKDPSTLNMSGVAVDTTNNLIRVTGNNVTLDGYNFTGWSVYITGGAQNTTVKDSYFYGGAGIYADPSTVNVSVLYNKFDGGGATDFSSFITLSGTGSKTVDYNWMQNSAQHFLELNGGGSLNYSYNLIMNGGTADGAHLNVSQFQSGTYNNPVISNNTIVQTPQAAGGELIQIDGWNMGAVATNALIANNTMIAVPTSAGDPSVSYMIDVQSGPTQSTATTGTVQNNYVAYAGGGAYGFNYPLGVNAGNIKFSGNIDMATGKTINADNSETATTTTPATTLAAPVIASFSTDSSVVGDHITNDNILTLTGTAAANSAVTVFDGSAQIGKTTASSSGSWSYITSVLTDAIHVLKVTDTVSGVTSAASSPLTVTVDTVAPNAPVETGASIVSGTTKVQLTGTAEANSTLQVYDGTTQVGTATANSSGAWSLTTGTLTSGGHSFTTKATDAAGNTGLASAALAVTIPSAPTTPPTAPSAPTIAKFSTDSGVVGDHITNDNTLTLSGTAVANSTVKVFDGATQIATATADSTGAWSSTATALADGSHNLTATATNVSGTSTASAALAVTIDTHAPTAPVEVGDSIVNGAQVQLTGTAEANSTLHVYDGTTLVGTTTTNATGNWTLMTSPLSTGAHDLTATATDTAGNVSALSLPLDPVIGTTIESAGSTSLVEIGSNFYLNSGAGPELKYGGAAVVAGPTGWLPLGAEQTATGYEVAWKVIGVDQYTVWNTDSSGNYVSNAIGAVSGTSAALESLETSFHQDLNGDGVIGVPAASQTVIEAFGSTSLVEIGSNFYLNSGAGPELKYGGAAVVAGPTGWLPLGAEQTATGYEVAWKVIGVNQYTVWNTDSSGNYVSNAIGAVSGTNASLEALETSFHQDLNGDGVIGVPAASQTVIEAFGSTSLVEIGSNFYLNSGAGPELKYGGAAVVAGPTGWLPIGVEQTATGYEVAWKVIGVNQYTVWNTDSSGNYVSNAIGAVSGTNASLEALETSFHQDLNGDGVIGVPATVVANAPPSAVELTNLSESLSGIVTLKGTADASSHIQILDGTNVVGMVTSANDGTWSFTSSSAVSNTVHTFKAQELDTTAHVIASSGSAILGSNGSNTLTSAAGNDLLVGNGGADTFVFAANFGNDVIKDFVAGARGHDVIQFSTSVFDSFASVLAHATQVGQDVVISADANDSLTLKNTKLSALNSHDFHFA